MPDRPAPAPARRRRGSARIRLAALTGVLFLASGAVLVTAIYQWQASGASVRPATAAPPAPSVQGSPLAQAQARIQQLQYQVTALTDKLQSIQPHNPLVLLVITVGVMAVVSTMLGWLVAGRILRPLRAMTTATRQISEHDLGWRLAMPGPGNELTDLADTIDGLLARLQAAFDAQRQFVANASHELRTPLTLERAMLEVALADPAATAAALRATCEDVLAAGQQQEQLIEALLTLARSQRGLDHRELVDLAETARKVIQARQPQAQAREVSIQAALAPSPIAGDPGLTERMVANLADNALRYNVTGGRVKVLTGTRDGRAFLVIANTGPKVPPDQVQRLLQPFQRLNPGRAGESGGSGLGLSIVTAIAKAHEATISASPEPGGGLRIEVGLAALTDDAATPAEHAALQARHEHGTRRTRHRSAGLGLPRRTASEERWYAPATPEAVAPGMRHSGTEEADRPREPEF
jgi:signal transduction histidine kinase